MEVKTILHDKPAACSKPAETGNTSKLGPDLRILEKLWRKASLATGAHPENGGQKPWISSCGTVCEAADWKVKITETLEISLQFKANKRFYVNKACGCQG